MKPLLLATELQFYFTHTFSFTNPVVKEFLQSPDQRLPRTLDGWVSPFSPLYGGCVSSVGTSGPLTVGRPSVDTSGPASLDLLTEKSFFLSRCIA